MTSLVRRTPASTPTRRWGDLCPPPLLAWIEKPTTPLGRHEPWDPARLPPAIRDGARQVLAAHEAALAPSTELDVLRILGGLVVAFPVSKRSAAEWDGIIEQYGRLLGDAPAAVLAEAADAWCLEGRFFPMISELNALIRPRLEKLRERRNRLDWLLNGEPTMAAIRSDGPRRIGEFAPILRKA